MPDVPNIAKNPLHDVYARLLSAASAGRDASCSRSLSELRDRLGVAQFRDATSAYFAALSPLDQRRLAVSLSVHADSTTLAA